MKPGILAEPDSRQGNGAYLPRQKIFHPDITMIFADRIERINLWSEKLFADSSYTISVFGIKDINGETINPDSLDCNLKLLG